MTSRSIRPPAMEMSLWRYQRHRWYVLGAMYRVANPTSLWRGLTTKLESLCRSFEWLIRSFQPTSHSQYTGRADSSLFERWNSVADAGPTSSLSQQRRWHRTICLVLGMHGCHGSSRLVSVSGSARLSGWSSAPIVIPPHYSGVIHQQANLNISIHCPQMILTTSWRLVTSSMFTTKLVQMALYDQFTKDV